MIGFDGTEPARAASLAQHYEHCSRLVHTHDRDRWLASLFAPADKRPHLHALYAFNIEIARIRDLVSDPMPGEIRMRWWTDALQDEARGDVRAHPVADAFVETTTTCGLPRSDFQRLIDARRFDLYDDPMPDLPALISYCDATSSCLFRAAVTILSGQNADAAAHAAGIAYALTGLLRALPLHASRGQCFLPADVLAKHSMSPADVIAGRDTVGLRAALGELRAIAQNHLGAAYGLIVSTVPAARAAFLPLSLVPTHLAVIGGRAYDPFALAEIPQWRRQWRLWRASRTW
jgi:phytoene synthase